MMCWASTRHIIFMRKKRTMRKITSLLISVVMGIGAWAVPADPIPAVVHQTDGTLLTLRLVGDEYFHYHTTADGYTVVQNATGGYEYAIVRDDRLVASGMLAHDAAQRTPAEHQLLAQTGTHVRATQDVTHARRTRTRDRGPQGRKSSFEQSSFRGLVILISFEDRQFSVDDPMVFYDKMINERNYEGFEYKGTIQTCPGSMRDYFNDQSDGKFDPQFDIVGPVPIEITCQYPMGTTNAWRLFWAAVDALDGFLDYSQYDNDGDGRVDMVYFLVAGYSSNYSGNNSNYLWPHQAMLINYSSSAPIIYDNVMFGNYACSTELYGREAVGDDMPLGIGTMCHEFSHALGLPDLYDADYSGSGGQSHDPGEWDVMAYGVGANYGRTPCGYSAWERYVLGWCHPQEITQTGQYSLGDVAATGDALILRTPVENEYFILENRQQDNKWDAILPGHGMLIARVDSTDVSVWAANNVNINPRHNYYELLRAGNTTSGSLASDPFPGTNDITDLTNYTRPGLHCWDYTESDFEIHDIIEQDGIITFSVNEASKTATSLVEDFEQMEVTADNNAKHVQGNFAKWNFSSCWVAAPGDGLCMGEHAVAMISPSVLAMDEPLPVNAFRIEYKAFNSSSTAAKLMLYSSPDGTTWTKMHTDYFTVPGNSSEIYSQLLDFDQPMYYRIGMAGGSKKQPCYIDDIKFGYFDTSLTGDINGDGQVDIADVNAVINVMLGKSLTPNPSPDGEGSPADVNGDGEVDIADVNAIINIMLGKG